MKKIFFSQSTGAPKAHLSDNVTTVVNSRSTELSAGQELVESILFSKVKKNLLILLTYTQVGVAMGWTRGCHMRSNLDVQCVLQFTSTHELSDPPFKVVLKFFFRLKISAQNSLLKFFKINHLLQNF